MVRHYDTSGSSLYGQPCCISIKEVDVSVSTAGELIMITPSNENKETRVPSGYYLQQ